MANHTATKKSIRQTARRTVVNNDRRTRIRTFIKQVETAIENKDKKQAQEAFKKAESELMKGVSKGLYKLNTAARKVSRLSKRVKALA